MHLIELIILFYEILLLSIKQNILNTEVCKINNNFYLAKEKNWMYDVSLILGNLNLQPLCINVHFINLFLILIYYFRYYVFLLLTWPLLRMSRFSTLVFSFGIHGGSTTGRFSIPILGLGKVNSIWLGVTFMLICPFSSNLGQIWYLYLN